MHDLVKLLLAAMRSGDHALAASLTRALRGDDPLRDEASRSLAALARGPARWSFAAELAVRRIVRRLTAAAYDRG